MTMTNEQIDEILKQLFEHNDICGECKEDVVKLATALKSAIQDSARIEWLESQKRFDCPWQGENSIVFNWPDGTAIREAIDERRKA